jgi:hypothetical protein
MLQRHWRNFKTRYHEHICGSIQCGVIWINFKVNYSQKMSKNEVLNERRLNQWHLLISEISRRMWQCEVVSFDSERSPLKEDSGV